jgi:hypothetical protein
MKISLDSIISGFKSVTTLVSNFGKIQTDLNDKVLYRDNPEGEPNQMENLLDMNGYAIINQSNPVTVAGFNWEGDYSGATAYSVGDVVQYNGTAYIAIAESTGQTPPNATYWQIVVTANLPTQTGNQNKALTTDGSVSGWGSVHAAYVDFTNAGTGGVERTLQAKLSDVVSVKDFGAVGDGVTDDTAAVQAAIDFALSVTSGVDMSNGSVDSRVVISGGGAWYLISSTVGVVNQKLSGVTFDLNLRASNTFTLKSPMLSFTHPTGGLPFHYLDFKLRLDGAKRAAGFQIHLSNRCSATINATGCKGYAAQIGDPLSPPNKGHEFFMKNFVAGFSEWNDTDRVTDRPSADGYQLEVYDPDGHYFNTVIYDGHKGIFCNGTSNTFSVGHIWGLSEPTQGMNTIGDNPLDQFYFDDTQLYVRNGGKNLVAENMQWYNSNSMTLPCFVTLASDGVQAIENIKISGTARNTNASHAVQFFGLDEALGAFTMNQTNGLDFNILTTGDVQGYAHEISSGVTNALAEKVAQIQLKTELALNLCDQVNLIAAIPVQQNTYTFLQWHVVDRPTANEFSLASDAAWAGEFKYTASLNRS